MTVSREPAKLCYDWVSLLSVSLFRIYCTRNEPELATAMKLRTISQVRRRLSEAALSSFRLRRCRRLPGDSLSFCMR
jgi:hypothetical protein